MTTTAIVASGQITAYFTPHFFFQAEDGIRDKMARPFRLFSRLFPICMVSLAAGHKLLWIQVAQLFQHLVGIKAVHMAVD